MLKRLSRAIQKLARYLPGEPLGPFRYKGVRDDDPRRYVKDPP